MLTKWNSWMCIMKFLSKWNFKSKSGVKLYNALISPKGKIVVAVHFQWFWINLPQKQSSSKSFYQFLGAIICTIMYRKEAQTHQAMLLGSFKGFFLHWICMYQKFLKEERYVSREFIVCSISFLDLLTFWRLTLIRTK